MESLLPEILFIGDLDKLVEKGRALFFNYSGPLPDLTNQHLLRFIKGEGNALVDTNLYTKYGTLDYKLQIKDWTETEEFEKYAPLLLERFRKKTLSRFISNHIN